MLSLITPIIEGKDGIPHPEFDRYLGRAQNVDDVHDHLQREFMQM